MIEDYRQKLTESLEEQLRNNQDLNDALDQIKQDNQNIQDTMMNHLKIQYKMIIQVSIIIILES